MYCHGPVGIAKFVLYREVKCIVSFKRGSIAYSYLFIMDHFMAPLFFN